MLSVYGITDRGVLRSQNQDACCYTQINNDTAWGVVCDGMGGAKAGDIASKIGVEAFKVHMQKHFEENELTHAAALLAAVEEGNDIIFHCAASDKECAGMGTTLVGLIIEGNEVQVINIGDSRAYLISEAGIKRITRDHSVVETLVQKGSLTAEQARIHPQKNLITRALGTSRSAEADMFELQLENGQWILLCSDGLINEMPDDEMFQVIRRGESPEAVCEALLEIALAREASDNVTTILFRYEEKDAGGV